MSTLNPKNDCEKLQYHAKGSELSYQAMHHIRHAATASISHEAFMELVCRVCVDRVQDVYKFGFDGLKRREHVTYHVSSYENQPAAYFVESGEEYVFFPAEVKTPWSDISMDIEGLNKIKQENIEAIQTILSDLASMESALYDIKSSMETSYERREKMHPTVKEQIQKARLHFNDLKVRADAVLTQTSMTLESDRGTFSY